MWSAVALRAVASTSWMNSKNSVLVVGRRVGRRAVELDVVVVVAVDDDPGLLVLGGPLWLSLAVIVNAPVGAGRSTMFLAVLVGLVEIAGLVGIVTDAVADHVSVASRRRRSSAAPSSLPLKSSR